AAAKAKGFLWIDMEGSAYTDRTLDLYNRVYSRHPAVGVCLQAYLYRTAADVHRMLPFKPAIRLVKGAYAEPADRAVPAQRDVDLDRHLRVNRGERHRRRRNAVVRHVNRHAPRDLDLVSRQLSLRGSGDVLGDAVDGEHAWKRDVDRRTGCSRGHRYRRSGEG